jgi:NADP-dependent 3-hydroxy acid dehydrogenase YdfG
MQRGAQSSRIFRGPAPVHVATIRGYLPRRGKPVLHFSPPPPSQNGNTIAYVLITGTSKGIGLATALTLGRAGHEVYATMRDPSQAPELAERTAHEKLPIKISVMDVDSDTSVKTAIANIQKEAGHIDVLVNNAGVERNGSVEELPLCEFRAVMETNYFGPLRCIQTLVPQQQDRQRVKLGHYPPSNSLLRNDKQATYKAPVGLRTLRRDCNCLR